MTTELSYTEKAAITRKKFEEREEEKLQAILAKSKAKHQAFKDDPKSKYSGKKRKEFIEKTKSPEQVLKEYDERRIRDIEKLEFQIKRDESYFGKVLTEVMIKIYKDLSPTQQMILALLRKGINNTHLMSEHMTITQGNVLQNINILIGKGYAKPYKKLYFPIEFPDGDLKQASIDYWHGAHPVERDTTAMRRARVEKLRSNTIEKIKKSAIAKVELQPKKDKPVKKAKKAVYSRPSKKWKT